jgi:hypothetical protein
VGVSGVVCLPQDTCSAAGRMHRGVVCVVMQHGDGEGDALSVSALGQCSACHEGAGLAFPCVLGSVSVSAPRARIHVCTADTVRCLHRCRAVWLASLIHGVLGHAQGVGDLGDANARCCGHGGHGKHLRRITPGESLAVERCVPKRGCRAQQWVNRSIVRHCEWFNALHHLVQCKHSPVAWCA